MELNGNGQRIQARGGLARTRRSPALPPARSWALPLTWALALVGCMPDTPGGDVDDAQTPLTARTPLAAGPVGHRSVCGDARPGEARCHALVRTAADGSIQPAAVSVGLGPSDLQSAYQVPVTLGAGTTIAIVDAFDDPNAESDLATYRANYGLPPCTTANGCFRKVNQAGAASPLPSRNFGWELEISLDLDAASAVCPNCRILLVEGNTPDFSNLTVAVNTAARLGATVISNSYGSAEFSGETSLDSSYNHPGIAVFASTGDAGFGVQYPAASRFVTAVGGTSLTRSTAPRGWAETAWTGAGSGCSVFEAKPSWQHDGGCARRSVADLSAVADPGTGLGVFDSGNGGWLIVGGTSLASPVTAAIYAITGQGRSSAQYTYLNSGASFDVTSGSNGSCGGSYLCTAGVGYDGPTGNGTPRASVLAAQAHLQLDSPGVFDANFYLATNSDLHAAFGNDLAAARNHWLNTGIDEGRIAAPTFSSKFYISHYSDLQNAFGANYRAAMTHFLGQGMPAEGRRGSREFDVSFYVTHYADLQSAYHTDFAAALNHFVFQGLPIEGRRGSLEFDVTYYSDNPGDIRAAYGNNYVQALEHWIFQGLPIEGRKASADFDVRYYLATYADLQAAFGTNYPAALDHWINFGMAEGRHGVP